MYVCMYTCMYVCMYTCMYVLRCLGLWWTYGDVTTLLFSRLSGLSSVILKESEGHTQKGLRQ
jgi:hypothetical protein